MSRSKYTYTPRRRPKLKSGGAIYVSLSPLLLAPVILLAILGAWWVTRDSGDSAPLEESSVIAGSCVPGKACAGKTPTPSPRSATPRPRLQLLPAGADDPPPITGTSAVVLEEPCGKEILAQNEYMRLPPASLTKIMTALVAAEHTEPDDRVVIDVDGPALSLATDSTVMGIEPGMTLTMRDLLYGLLLPSGNDAAIQIAEEVGGTVSGFVRIMNQKADELGLEDTRFANPHGLDNDSLYSSAHDMAIMGRELLKDPLLSEIVRTRQYQPDWAGPPVDNVNLLLGFYEGALGIKTGYTDLAGQTIVAAAERNGRRLIVSVMGAQTEIYGDASGLLEWAFAETDSACAASRPTP